jgi:hypothetical protein
MNAFRSRPGNRPAIGCAIVTDRLISPAALILTMGLLILNPNRADANTRWTGAVDDNWFNAGNWDNGIPDVNFAATQRAQIEATTDIANWPVIKNSQTVTTSQRVFLPLAPIGPPAQPEPAPVTYARLTIESGGTLNAGNDFRGGEDAGNEFQVMIASLNVAGMLTLGNRSRFGNNDYMTIDVDVTGAMIHTDSQEAFRIGGGENSSADFDISGNGFVDVTGEFELFAGSLLSLSDNGKVTLREFVLEDEDDLGNPIFIPFTKTDLINLVTGYATQGWFEGLTDTYSGSETLTGLGNGLAYYEEATSISIVAANVEVAGLPGDFNSDDIVDAADYVVWRKNETDNSPLPNDNGLTTQAERFDLWRNNFGAQGGGGAVAGSVPEPSTLALLGFGMISLAVGGLRKPRHSADSLT